ncbi:MAG TPA: HAD-IC family P-type ATPase [Thermoanaerobaculia bacterium]|nr:HAD-IC family P-type ATPase [Thermoanaerobaculia bacterium]
MSATAGERPSGLSSARARELLAEHGPNRYVPAGRTASFAEFLRTLADPMAIMLLAAAILSFAAGQRRDGIVLLVALFPVLAVDVVLEARSRQALKKLAQAVSPRATVVRDGVPAEIPTEEIVPGDILVIREGDVLHADGTVAWSAHLAIDESMLTGESEPKDKIAGTPFYAGSRVLTGQGGGEVASTGLRTQYGRIASLVAEAPAGQTPIQEKTAKVVSILGKVALVVAAAVFGLAWLRERSLARAFVSAISVAMSAMPEEFPLVFTLFLSLGAWRLSKHRVLVRRLASVETLGSTTVICTDKTGTLTLGQFVLEAVLPFGDFTEADLLESAVLACEIDPSDPLDQTILESARAAGLDPGRLHSGGRLVRDHSWDALGKHMSHVWRTEDAAAGTLVVAAKGALEGILEHCALTPGRRAEAEARHAELAAGGLRLLAVAGKTQREGSEDRASDESNLALVGFLGFRDPLRPEIAAAVADCRTAGIAIKLVTGDHPVTAQAIAESAGIVTGREPIATGDELAALSPPDFARRVAESPILARILPEQKYAIVDALRAGGEVVAMAGDGINDAPALRRASIGISMGARATEVARAAADLVLLDDNFGSIVQTIREGRRIYDNLEKAFRYLLAFHVPIVLLAVVVPLLGFPLLLLPVHLVWLELVVHPVSALLFEGEPADPDVMRRPPRPPGSSLLGKRSVRSSVATGALLAAAVLAIYAAAVSKGEDAARGFALAALIPGTLLIAWAERAGDRPWRRVPAPNTGRFWGIMAPIAVSLPLLVAWPTASQILHATFPSSGQWAIALAAATAAVAWRAFGTGEERRKLPVSPDFSADRNAAGAAGRRPGAPPL